MATKTEASSGLRLFLTLLLVLFIGLKLTNYINWSWWWVLSPLWIPIAAALSIVAAITLIADIFAIIDR
jgi:hypothetical protein